MEQIFKIRKDNKRNKKLITSDYFIIEKEKIFAGKHIIIDFWEPKFNNSISTLRSCIKHAAIEARATMLHIHLHRFGKNQGISGVAVLAESHISVHTWPERNYMAFDIFMCGDTSPELAVEFLVKKLHPQRKKIKTIKRGEIIDK